MREIDTCCINFCFVLYMCAFGQTVHRVSSPFLWKPMFIYSLQFNSTIHLYFTYESANQSAFDDDNHRRINNYAHSLSLPFKNKRILHACMNHTSIRLLLKWYLRIGSAVSVAVVGLSSNSSTVNTIFFVPLLFLQIRKQTHNIKMNWEFAVKYMFDVSVLKMNMVWCKWNIIN